MHGFLVQLIQYFLPLIIALGVIIGFILLLRKYAPEKRWLGLLLSFVFPGFGQWYLKRGFPFVMLVIFFSMALGYMVKDLWPFILATCLFSLGVMYLRLKYRER